MPPNLIGIGNSETHAWSTLVAMTLSRYNSQSHFCRQKMGLLQIWDLPFTQLMCQSPMQFTGKVRVEDHMRVLTLLMALAGHLSGAQEIFRMFFYLLPSTPCSFLLMIR